MKRPEPLPEGTLLRASALQVRRGRRTVLHGVDLEVARGEVIAVLGPNGAGKSTLLDALGGALSPQAGRVERAGRVAIALQAPGLARRSARANVDLALAWWGVPRRERRGRTRDALSAMHAEHLAGRAATSLSGGEQRRVHLARAVAIQPDVLLLDEPFAGLDPATHAALRDDATSALRTSAGAVVVVVHDRAEAWAMADRLVVLMDGLVAAQGRPAELLERPPTPSVARFLGYDGELRRPGGGVLLTRPAHVRIEPGGDVSGTVARVVPLEDGARVELDTGAGRISSVVAGPPPRPGDTVRATVRGGVRFDRP